MNSIISKIGSIIVTITVFLFALFILTDIFYGQVLVCLFLPIGFILMTSGLHLECDKDHKVAGDAGLIFAAVYCVFIMFVYYTQLTTVANEELSEQAAKLINFRNHGFIFNFDILGYGMMALSTFFTGLSLKASTKADKWLKGLLIGHGAFFPGCVFMPMTGMFVDIPKSSGGISGGDLALVVWCLYFLPIGIIAYIHFAKTKEKKEDLKV